MAHTRGADGLGKLDTEAQALGPVTADTLDLIL